MADQWLIGKDLEGSGPEIIQVLSQNSLKGIDENHRNLSQDIVSQNLSNTRLELQP
jgi:hypothetical protein